MNNDTAVETGFHAVMYAESTSVPSRCGMLQPCMIRSDDLARLDSTWVEVLPGDEILDRLVIEGELFEEAFFAYHEDADLGWRARRLGYRVRYVPSAVAVHARGWKKAERKRIPVVIRRYSFKNHYLQIVKNETLRDFVWHAPAILGWEILRLEFTVLRDPMLLPACVDAARALPDAFRKRRVIATRACELKGRT